MLFTAEAAVIRNEIFLQLQRRRSRCLIKRKPTSLSQSRLFQRGWVESYFVNSNFLVAEYSPACNL